MSVRTGPTSPAKKPGLSPTRETAQPSNGAGRSRTGRGAAGYDPASLTNPGRQPEKTHWRVQPGPGESSVGEGQQTKELPPKRHRAAHAAQPIAKAGKGVVSMSDTQKFDEQGRIFVHSNEPRREAAV